MHTDCTQKYMYPPRHPLNTMCNCTNHVNVCLLDGSVHIVVDRRAENWHAWAWRTLGGTKAMSRTQTSMCRWTVPHCSRRRWEVFAGWIGSISKDVVTPSIGVYTSEQRIICSNTCAIWRVSKKGQSVGPRPYLTLILSTKGGHGKVHSKGVMLKKEGKPYCLTAPVRYRCCHCQ